MLKTGPAERYELEVRRSKFIALVARVSDEAAAREMIATTRQDFPDAGHHCSAYLLGAGREIQRSNDDGEPSGTAGAPILEVLISRSAAPAGALEGRSDLSDVCAVVVRYFGGTLLGTGGLIRAYSEAAAAALNQARLVTRQEMTQFRIVVPHATVGRYRHELERSGHKITAIRYSERAELNFVTPAQPEAFALAQNLIHSVDRATAGVLTELETIGSQWADV